MENTQAYEAYLDKVVQEISSNAGIFSSFTVENMDSADFTEVSKMQIKSALRTAYLRGMMDAQYFSKTK